MRRSFGWQNPELSRAFTLEDRLKHLKLNLSFQESNLCFLLFPFFFPHSFPSLRLLSFPPASFPPFLMFFFLLTSFFSFSSFSRILPLLTYSPLSSCLFHFLFQFALSLTLFSLPSPSSSLFFFLSRFSPFPLHVSSSSPLQKNKKKKKSSPFQKNLHFHLLSTMF